MTETLPRAFPEQVVPCTCLDLKVHEASSSSQHQEPRGPVPLFYKDWGTGVGEWEGVGCGHTVSNDSRAGTQRPRDMTEI